MKILLFQIMINILIKTIKKIGYTSDLAEDVFKNYTGVFTGFYFLDDFKKYVKTNFSIDEKLHE